ncbi:MAG: hypothetical protein ACRDT8_09445 [Micromonosporaceae bacterium]
MLLLATWSLAVLGLGLITGLKVERARRGWADLRATKAQIPFLRAAARTLSIKALGATALTMAVAVWSLWTLNQETPQ